MLLADPGVRGQTGVKRGSNEGQTGVKPGSDRDRLVLSGNLGRTLLRRWSDPRLTLV
jgi:hypothetical protein